MGSDPKAGLTDDELVEMMRIEAAINLPPLPMNWPMGGLEKGMRAVLSRIRRPLEARGIEIAAQYCETRMRIPAGDVSDELITLARQHAAGEDQS